MIVQCSHCHSVYDLGGVEVIARYADCDLFKTPCCGRQADTRPWVGLPSYRRLEPDEVRLVQRARAKGQKVAVRIYEDGSSEQFRLAAAKNQERTR